MIRIIEIIVSRSGATRLETKGFTGASCQVASQLLENALGIKQTEQVTAEFYAQAVSQQSLQEGRP